jgi:membrane-associated phospholipid phosphatase
MKRISLIILSLLSANLFCQNLDIDLLKQINVDRNSSLDGTFKLITNSAAPVSIATPIILCGIGLINHDSTTIRNSLTIGSSIAVTVIFTTVAKYAFNRPRPFETYSFIEKETSGGSPSFPSGHTSEAFAFATSVSLSYPKWYVIGPSFLWAGAVGYSRMDLGVHYPSDVLAGALLGSACAWITFKVNKRLNGKQVVQRSMASDK